MKIVLHIFLLFMTCFNAMCSLHILDFYAWWFRKQRRTWAVILVWLIGTAVLLSTFYSSLIVTQCFNQPAWYECSRADG
jgi:hypothetical protein